MNDRIHAILLASVFLLAVLTRFAVSAEAGKDKDSNITPTITAEQAIISVKAALPKLTAGKCFVKTGKKGEKKLEVTLVLEEKIVSHIRLNPATGEIIPRGCELLTSEALASQGQALKIVQEAIPYLDVASVQLGEKGEWKVGLTFKKAVVASIRVHGGNGSILPDCKASKDSTIY